MPELLPPQFPGMPPLLSGGPSPKATPKAGKTAQDKAPGDQTTATTAAEPKGSAALYSVWGKARGLGGGDASRAHSSHPDPPRPGWASGRSETATAAAGPHLTILQAVTEAHAAERCAASVSLTWNFGFAPWWGSGVPGGGVEVEGGRGL